MEIQAEEFRGFNLRAASRVLNYDPYVFGPPGFGFFHQPAKN
jgi:hypothetical protein